MKYLAVVGIATALLACGVGDGVVTGLGNSGNRLYAPPVIDELAEHLAANAVVAAVTDDMLRTAFEAISARAAEGDPEAALILFRVAEEQRRAEKE